MPSSYFFDPNKVAYYEKAGWEAYYDRNWLRVFGLMVQLNREEFSMPLLTAIAAAIDIVRASLAFKPVENDLPAATAHLSRFYEKARRSTPLQTDAPTLARLEMDYWVVHRQLALARMNHSETFDPASSEDIAPMVEALVNLHAALFPGTPASIRRSAELRALAAKTVDRITGKYSDDFQKDWLLIENLLQQAYREIMPAKCIHPK